VGPRKTTTRERLITTAAELFRRQGYAQTGVNQIIQEANATSGSFYHFFPAKEDLLLAVVDHLAEVFEVQILDGAAERSGDPIGELFAVFDLYRLQLREGGFTFASPMAGLSAEVSESHPEVRARLVEIFAAWTTRIEDLLREAGDRLPASLDRGGFARLVVCTMEGAVLCTRLNRDLAPFDAATAQLRSYVGLLEDHAPPTMGVPATSAEASTRQPQSSDWRSW
jgi:TetR/AcrR family transcriptional repressor of lmrAB and yxaGH operons